MRDVTFFTLISLFIFTSSFATIIHVPGTQPTIQAGINVAMNGDTILVAESTYYENINFKGKTITVSSQFIMDGDTNHINNTIIDGSQPLHTDSGSVVYFISGEETNSVLCGFTITRGAGTLSLDDPDGGGIFISKSGAYLKQNKIVNNSVLNWRASGGGIFCDSSNMIIENVILSGNSANNGGGIASRYSDLILKNVTINSSEAIHAPVVWSGKGGGILSRNSNLILENVNINHNISESDAGGILAIASSINALNVNIKYNQGSFGGISCDSSQLKLTNVTISDNSANVFGGGIYIVGNSEVIFDGAARSNIYFNYAERGSDLYSRSENNISVILDTFTVDIPFEQYASPLEKFTFNILNSKVTLINDDLYVSPTGNNTNSGLSPLEPLKTVSFALSRIYADSLHRNTIHLSDGIYSTTASDEVFPMNLFSYITLNGESRNGTILDAEGESNVIGFTTYDKDVKIQNLTLTGASHSGIYCHNSDMNIRNVDIRNNSSTYVGAGIVCIYSNLEIENSIIRNNIAEEDGGGIFVAESDLSLRKVSIHNNSALSRNGGGIWFGKNNNIIFDSQMRSNIYYNSAPQGNDMYNYSQDNILVFVDTFTVLTPTQHYAYPIDKFDFDILHAKLTDRNGQLNTIINKTSLDSLIHYVRILSGEDSVSFSGNTYLISSRAANHPGNDIAADYIKYKLQRFGLSAYDQVYSSSGRNVYAVQTGSEYPDDKYIICAHYDAVTSYCADDNASGAAAILEAARLLSNFETKYTIIYAFWDEEEIGQVGSKYFAQQANLNNENILGVINLEMLGWDGNNDGLIDIHTRDIANSIELSSTIENLNMILKINLSLQTMNPGASGSDHGSFWQNGYSATVFGGSFDDFNPYYHTSNDRIDKFNFNYFHKLSKLAVSSISFFVLPDEATEVLQNIILVSKTDLYQNYPNPFNPVTMINYQLPMTSAVELSIYNLLGQKVATLVNERKRAGYHQVEWDASGFASGVYLYRLEAEGYVETKKMVLMK